jgi:hypothetical protein
MLDFMRKPPALPPSARSEGGRDYTGKDVLWKQQRERLDYRVGPWSLGAVEFRSLVLATSPFNVDGRITPPATDAFGDSYDVVVIPAVPVTRDLPLLSFSDGAVRYVVRHGDRQAVDLTGSFADYLNRFSKKSRGNLHRSVRKLSDPERGTADLRIYETASQIVAFRELAVAVSHRSYKQAAGIGFPESFEFAAQLRHDADRAALRGYALHYRGRPVAYALCRIEGDVITYKQTGYDNEVAHHSPGTSLLYLLIKHLFDENRFRLLDFDALEHYSYKAYFATISLRCARILFFKPTIRNLFLVALHCATQIAWQGASVARHCLRKCAGRGLQLVARGPVHQIDGRA